MPSTLIRLVGRYLAAPRYAPLPGIGPPKSALNDEGDRFSQDLRLLCCLRYPGVIGEPLLLSPNASGAPAATPRRTKCSWPSATGPAQSSKSCLCSRGLSKRGPSETRPTA
jgi:hypothetical protein